MKYFIPIVITLALALLIYNATMVNWSSPLMAESTVALIGMVGCACAIVLLLILHTSRKIAEKAK